MDNYFRRYISTTSDSASERIDTNCYRYGYFDREEDLHTESYTNPFYREENEIFVKSCEGLSQAGHATDITLHDEFTCLVSLLEKHMPEKDTLEASGGLLRLSELADEALCDTNQIYDPGLSSYYSETPSNITDLVNLNSVMKETVYYLCLKNRL